MSVVVCSNQDFVYKQMYKLEVQKCPEDRGDCEECLTGSCVSQGRIPANE